MQLGTEDKQKSLKRLIIVFLIFFAIMAIIMAILYFDRIKQLATGTNTPRLTENQNQNQPSSAQPQLSAEEIEKVKIEVVTGKRQDVPEGIDLDIGLIKADYLYTCYLKNDFNEKLGCYDFYYTYNDASYKQQKENCEKLSGIQNNNCLDNLYYYASANLEATLCPAIKNETLREKCLASIG
jgi:hypothetical protein